MHVKPFLTYPTPPVVWNWKSVFNAKLSSDDESGILASKFCRISIRREIITWKVTSKKMGFFDINLAEHARGGLVTLKRELTCRCMYVCRIGCR